MELLKLRDAAEILNISYPTLKQWIYRGKLRSIKTPGGHHRIARSEIDRITTVKTAGSNVQSISGRNKLFGTILEVKTEGLLTQVTLEVSGQIVTAIITRQSSEELGLRKGMRAYAIIKATEVMIATAKRKT
ncbi:MAG TPA: helix-turn-helix transcriptional regulator [Terriglobia bacterium]|nr:helix-turn-helix transcriptional regulator [Terriglobia bacterium]